MNTLRRRAARARLLVVDACASHVAAGASRLVPFNIATASHVVPHHPWLGATAGRRACTRWHTLAPRTVLAGASAAGGLCDTGAWCHAVETHATGIVVRRRGPATRALRRVPHYVMRHARASGSAGSTLPTSGTLRGRRPVFGPRRSSSSGNLVALGAPLNTLSAASAALAAALRRLASPKALARSLLTWPPTTLLCLVALLWLLLWLGHFHPGDETLRALSDGPLRLMLSPAGVSFGKAYTLALEVKPKPGAVPPPVFSGSLNLTAEALALEERGAGGCFAAVLDDEATLVSLAAPVAACLSSAHGVG